MRDTVPEVDEYPWDPGHEIEDVILARLDEDALGEYLGPELFPSRKQELQAKTEATKTTNIAQGAFLWKMFTGEQIEEHDA